jgi:hypothetical protein
LLFHTPTKYGSDRFRQIFIDHWERWWDYRREEIPTDQRAYVQEMVEKMMDCRNPQCGYARYVCPACHEERIVPFSCKTRFCPSCGKVRTDEWVGRIAQELLDVPHLHLTLTIAKEMRRCFDRDRSLLKLLLTTAADAVRQVIAVTYGDIQVGLVYTCHTFGRDLVFKPHVHLILTKGGLNPEGEWVAIDTIPGGRLAAIWRYLLCHPRVHGTCANITPAMVGCSVSLIRSTENEEACKSIPTVSTPRAWLQPLTLAATWAIRRWPCLI